MAKQRNALTHQGDVSSLVAPRHQSHKSLEALLLLSSLGILCILFSFFALDLANILNGTSSFHEQEKNKPHTLTPPEIEVRALDNSLIIASIDQKGGISESLYRSDMNDDIADFTLFAVPQTNYQGFIYLQPILPGNLPNLNIYPLDIETKTLKAATLNVPSRGYVLSEDQTIVGVVSEETLSLYALDDGSLLAQEDIDPAWASLFSRKEAYLSMSPGPCLSALPLNPIQDLEIPNSLCL